MNNFIKLCILLIGFISSFCYSEVLIINRIQQEQSIDMPSKGLSMTQVIHKYGEPLSKEPPIGKPAITEWKYTDYSVYFENTWVIDSVAYKASANELGPKYIK